MNKEEITNIVKKQRNFFGTGTTLSVQYRKNALLKLKKALTDNQTIITNALKQDLGKSADESYMCEIGMTISEIGYMLRHINSLSKEKRVKTPLAQFAAHSYIKPCPYGVTLIMSPWNYPLLLTLEPLVDSLAAGNTAIIKPSAYSSAVSEVIKTIITNIFPAEYVTVITGGREENTFLLDQKFDYIFFTGSKTVGHIVLEKAAKYLTPVTLELGGKSPCIVDETANLKLAARRIVFGKLLNCGQTCVAPDYILCHSSVKTELLKHLKNEIIKQYDSDYLKNQAYGKIVNYKHFQRIVNLINTEKIFYGGKTNKETLQIEPTVLDNISWEDNVMKEEIFGPVLPVLTFENPAEVINTINSHDKPLALYLFTTNKKTIRKITAECNYGGGCINDVIIHLATSNMGFGGVGESGMGAYHGKSGFDTFTHYKSIVNKSNLMDLPIRYQPYTKTHGKLIRFFLK